MPSMRPPNSQREPVWRAPTRYWERQNPAQYLDKTDPTITQSPSKHKYDANGTILPDGLDFVNGRNHLSLPGNNPLLDTQGVGEGHPM